MDKFHITVGTAPQHGERLNLANELKLLKTAILYADKVKFCSLTSSLLISLLQLGNLTADQLADFYVQVANDEVFAKNVELYHQLKVKRRRTKKELIAYQQIRAMFRDSQESMRQSLEKAVSGTGLDSVGVAIQTGIVELQTLAGSTTDEFTKQYLDAIGNAVLAGDTYPLFDDLTGEIVSLAIREGKLAPTEISVNRAKQVGLSSDLLKRLPLFDDVPMDQIIDIRKELDKPLIRFRSAIIRFTRDIQSASWDKEFPKEAEQVFREYVEPAVLDIEEACKSNRLIFRLLPDIVEKSAIPVSTSALGLLLAEASQLPAIVVGGLGFTAGASAVALRSVKEWREKNQAIEGNQLYFYYKAEKLLSK